MPSMPGCRRCPATPTNVRQPSSRLAELAPDAGVRRMGRPGKEHSTSTAAMIVTRTEGATPFRLVTHIGDVGHAGGRMTGMGKSVCSLRWRVQFRRYRSSHLRLRRRALDAHHDPEQPASTTTSG